MYGFAEYFLLGVIYSFLNRSRLFPFFPCLLPPRSRCSLFFFVTVEPIRPIGVFRWVDVLGFLFSLLFPSPYTQPPPFVFVVLALLFSKSESNCLPPLALPPKNTPSFLTPGPLQQVSPNRLFTSHFARERGFFCLKLVFVPPELDP